MLTVLKPGARRCKREVVRGVTRHCTASGTNPLHAEPSVTPGCVDRIGFGPTVCAARRSAGKDTNVCGPSPVSHRASADFQHAGLRFHLTIAHLPTWFWGREFPRGPGFLSGS